MSESDDIICHLLLEEAAQMLADVAFSEDMTLAVARAKAQRLYLRIRKVYPISAYDPPEPPQRSTP